LSASWRNIQKGNYRNGSDIDLTLMGSALTYRILTRIETEIDDLLLPYLFDLSIFQQIDNPDVVDHINRVGSPLYEQNRQALSAETF
jgi:uncharacterized protein